MTGATEHMALYKDSRIPLPVLYRNELQTESHPNHFNLAPSPPPPGSASLEDL
jgi:hypothetical protein